jgi:F0F1-type ATP synthase assembly protein I
MKTMYLKEHGKVLEKIEIQEETKWIFIKYIKGNFKKSSYIIKNDPETVKLSMDKFFEDCHASKEIIADVKDPLKKGKVAINANYQQFINFLITTSSVHIMIGFALGICIYGGYQLGVVMDTKLNNSPSFTVIGVLFGLGVGILTAYVIMNKYLDLLSLKGIKNGQARLKGQTKKREEEAVVEWPIIEVTLNDVRFAIREFSDDLPAGIKRTILVKEDNNIDVQKLAPYLKGIPNRPFYMSKETYDIFEEKEKQIPAIIDRVQKAVYLFYKMNGHYPMMPYDSLHRVNYFQLIQEHYLDKHPGIDLYMTGYEGLITHIKPEKKRTGVL